MRFLVPSRVSMHLEVVALRHQIAVLNRCRRPRPRLTQVDRMLWAWLSETWYRHDSRVHWLVLRDVVAP
jgi:putative transposase